MIAEYADELAAVIVEPLQRLIPPEPGFLEALREETKKHGIVLIFDEVVTGFRLAYGGAQEKYAWPVLDLCTLGKVIGGGFPARSHRRQRGDHGALRSREGWRGIIPLPGRHPQRESGCIGRRTEDDGNTEQPGSYECIARSGRAIMNALEEEFAGAGIAAQVVGDPGAVRRRLHAE